MCGKLATYLRMCGHDVAYALDRGVETDDEVLRVAREEGRCLLTRDRDLARRTTRSATGDGDPVVDDAAIELTERTIEGQLREVAAAGVDVTLPERPRRCGTCNGRLRPLEPGTEPEHAPADESVWSCVECGQAFWRGSHWDDVHETLAEVRADVDESPDSS